MKQFRNLLLALISTSATMLYAQTPAAHFDMSLTDGQLTESVSKMTYQVNSQLPATTSEGLDGKALRFDGYSNYVKASLSNTFSTASLTMNVVLAVETYPMMQVDIAETTPTYATICGNLDEEGKKGFAIQLSSQGDLRAVLGVNYGGGYLITIQGSQKLPRGEWNQLSLAYDKAGNIATLYLNGTSIGSKKVNKCDLLSATDFYIGKDQKDVKAYDLFCLNTFCGLIDDITIYNEVVTPTAFTASATPDFNYPAERYAANLWRPQFHGMPSGSWTNESHGMIYSNGRYHVFFQKNANGPYMSRLHWGHISSENLYDWKEEPIAIYPGESFDIKGCWSGCVYEDGDNTYILYTGVDNEKARIIQAKATDNTLVKWEDKKVIIDGRPSGLSDDFRDPYYFEANGNKYIVVGTAKGGVGACTLHQYKNGSWTNDGAIFFNGSSASQHGIFWEMPNVTPMGDGKWLFTCTPLGTSAGVRTLCWVGTIGTDGKFTPDGNGIQYLEMGGISRDGYGLLSPSICQHDGKTLLMGIVPDKLATRDNYKMGWAHNYSLPREISLDAEGQLIQKPYSGLTALRGQTSATVSQTLDGTATLSPVSGHQIELYGRFTIADGDCGFHFLKAGDRQASLTYQPATGMLTLDITSLQKTYNGPEIWVIALPQKVVTGETLTLHVFFDGSIADIFVNDRWASSVRIFPTETSEVDTEVFATAPTAVSAQAWVLDAGQSTAVTVPTMTPLPDRRCYDLQGRCLSGKPQKGLYILNGKKYVAR